MDIFCTHEKTFPIAYLVGSKKRPYVITEDVTYKLSNGKLFTVPKGFRLDGTSVPTVLRSLMPRVNDKIIGSTLHDYMYMHDHRRLELGDRKARKFADKEMLYFWDKYDNDRKKENKIMYFLVRRFGGLIFKKWNTK